jgi:hypothetical protein
MQGNTGQRGGACHGDRVGEQPEVSIEDGYIARDGEHLPPPDPVTEGCRARGSMRTRA